MSFGTWYKALFVQNSFKTCRLHSEIGRPKAPSFWVSQYGGLTLSILYMYRYDTVYWYVCICACVPQALAEQSLKSFNIKRKSRQNNEGLTMEELTSCFLNIEHQLSKVVLTIKHLSSPPGLSNGVAKVWGTGYLLMVMGGPRRGKKSDIFPPS